MAHIPIAQGGDGKIYLFFKQEKDWSCAAACLRMMWPLAGRPKYEESVARATIETTAQGKINWDDGGVDSADFVLCLTRYFKYEVIDENEVFKHIEKINGLVVGVLFVKRDGGHHAVLVTNKCGGGEKYLILDPAAGIGLMDSDDFMMGSYLPFLQKQDNSLVRAEGSTFGEIECLVLVSIK
ncbi:hypothetical protein [Tropicimonas sp. S265A]|uniref:hypothetical protein n=1 Tax=Tropicimonas sp. S265A TaxID=3415134 RepID=UPI003C79B843